MIKIIKLDFAYPSSSPIFEDFSWNVARGDAYAVIGPSGCGKTTLLMLAAGLCQPSSGTLSINGQKLNRPRPRTGLILQDYGLLPWATVYDNAALGLKIRGFYGPDGKHTPADESLSMMEDRVNHWLVKLGLSRIAHHYPNQISGGQRQRTAIARTLVLQPDLLLMDEPFGALDALNRENLQDLTLELHTEQGLTSIIVTHNIEEAVIMGQKILVLGNPPNRDARVIENPSAGKQAYRSHPEFLERVAQIRALLGKDTNEMA